MALYRELFEPPDITREQWDIVRQLRKRVIFFGWFQSASAILGIIPVYIGIFGYGIESPEAGYLLILFFAMFLLPGCMLAFFIFRLKITLGKGLDHLGAGCKALKSIAPGWGISSHCWKPKRFKTISIVLNLKKKHIDSCKRTLINM